MKCIKCGAIIPEDSKFCPECGAEISIVIDNEGKIVCPSCKTSNPADSAFCCGCGFKLSERTKKQSKKRTKIWIPIICVAAVIVILIIIISTNNTNNKARDVSNKAEAYVSTPRETEAPIKKYPEMSPKKTYSLIEGESFGVKSKFPDTWEIDKNPKSGSKLFFIKKKGYSAEGTTNINIVPSEKTSKLTEADVQEYIAYLQEGGIDGYQVSNCEIVTINGDLAFYFDAKMVFSDEMIDEAIKEGYLSREAVDLIGGNQAFRELMEYQTTQMYVVVDGTMVVITGTYYDKAEKDDVLDAMCIVAKNASIVS